MAVLLTPLKAGIRESRREGLTTRNPYSLCSYRSFYEQVFDALEKKRNRLKLTFETASFFSSGGSVALRLRLRLRRIASPWRGALTFLP